MFTRRVISVALHAIWISECTVYISAFMIRSLKPVLGKLALVYTDDFLICARTPDELIDNLREVFHLIKKAGLKLKPKRCEIFAEIFSFL